MKKKRTGKRTRLFFLLIYSVKPLSQFSLSCDLEDETNRLATDAVTSCLSMKLLYHSKKKKKELKKKKKKEQKQNP